MPEREDFALRAVQEWTATLPSLDVSADELSVFIRLSRIGNIKNRIDDRALRQFEHVGIRGPEDFRVLALLRRSPAGLANSELMDQLGGSKAGVSARLERLTSHGVTERVPSQTDRRSHTNVLTAAGADLADQAVTAVVNARKLLVASLSPEHIAAFAETLATIIESIEPGG